MMEQVARLHLKRPMVFDLETTGTKGGGRIVEMAMVKLMPDGTVIKSRKSLGASIAFSSTRCPSLWSPAWFIGVRRRRGRCADVCRVAPGLLKWLHG